MNDLPYRQIHLDFHTSPHIPDVGSNFNAKEFAAILKRNHINSINLFGKCHHGFYYYPTKLGHVHPALKPGLDLLGEQIKACRDEGIRIAVYTTVVWAEDTCDTHPEWMQVDTKGVLGSRPPFLNKNNIETRSWRSLCMNNGSYVDYLKREMLEIYDLYHPDGLWIDIIWQFNCICPHCLADMKQMRLNPENINDVLIHDRLVELKFTREIYGYLKGIDRKWDIYFNGGPAEFDEQDQIEISTARRRECNDFIDIESLPSDLWGYTHFPVLVNYCNRFDKPITMMNGKFHKTWGDFGTLRNMAALEYECFRALANGAGVCIGDQLHPAGMPDNTVYRRIGEVFSQIEKKEPWCRNTKKIAQIGVYAANRVLENERAAEGTMGINVTNEGAYRILTELNYLFDFVDFEDDINKYEVLVLPDTVRLPAAAAGRLSKYITSGGRVLFTGVSGLSSMQDAFALPELDLTFIGPEEYSPAYADINPNSGFFADIPKMDYVVYERGQRIDAGHNKVLAYLTLPYFNRTWEHFCSHRQTPPQSRSSDFPFAVEGKNFIYITHPLFSDYAINGCKVHKDIIAACLARLIEAPLIKAKLPSTAEVTLRKKDDYKVLHILHYIPMKRCKTIEIIEDVIPIYNIFMQIRMEKKPEKIYLVPEKTSLEFIYENGYAKFTLPELNGHQMVILKEAP